MKINKPTDGKKIRLTNEQKEKIKKYTIFSAMSIACLICIWFIFTPSKKDVNNQQSGFNTEIPMPKNQSLIEDKVSAYEQQQAKSKQEERMRSLEDFTSVVEEEKGGQSNDAVLLDDSNGKDFLLNNSASQSRSSSIQKSLNAYQDVNRTLENFYETKKEDPEKEMLKKELEELKAQVEESENRKNSIDEQMAVMEKSFQMASKYMPSNVNAPATNISSESVNVENETEEKISKEKITKEKVSGIMEQTITTLPQEISNEDFIAAFSVNRNLGFITATSEVYQGRKNTISACVHQDQTLIDGESVRLRLLEPMRAGKIIIRENSILSGFAKIQGERLQITIMSLENNGIIIPVEIIVFDTDGQRGIFIPDTREINAVKEVAANMGSNAGTSISLSSDAGEQFAADMGRSVVQGVSQFFSKKMREVKVSLKAGYRIFLLPASDIKNNQFANI